LHQINWTKHPPNSKLTQKNLSIHLCARIFMLQRLSSVSVLSGSLIVASMLLNACSSWGSNPPPRYNSVYGERRAPVLNPGGAGVVRPADEIMPPTGVYARPLDGGATPAPMPQSGAQAMPYAPNPNIAAPYPPAAQQQFDPEVAPAAAPTASPAKGTPFSSYTAPQSAPASQSVAMQPQQMQQPVALMSPFGTTTASVPAPAQVAMVAPVAAAKPINNFATMPAVQLGQSAPAAGGTPPSVAVATPPSVVADVAALSSGETSNATAATWENIPGTNPLTPALSPEEKMQADASVSLAELAPAAGGASSFMAAANPAMPVTPAQIEMARAVLGKMTNDAQKKKVAQQQLTNQASDLFASAKEEEKQDAILAVSRDSRNPINTTAPSDASAFTYTATPMANTLNIDAASIDTGKDHFLKYASIADNSANASEGESAARAPEANTAYLPESRYARFRSDFHSYRQSKLGSSTKN
jgi:hypothetical protein